MKEVILITGSGMIAKRLAEKLVKENYSIRFLSRNKKKNNYFVWDIENNYIEKGAFNNVSHIIHLAGENIVNKRWNSIRKNKIISSRINSSQLILNTLKRQNVKIISFISASAIGYYGAKMTETIYCENDNKGNDFISNVCDKWEITADNFAKFSIADRVVKIRIGIVLSKKGGLLNKMIIPIKYYLGAAIGSGNQYVPWIHIDDLCDIIQYAIKNKEITGVFNAVAPEHITNKELTKVIAKSMNKSILLPNVPGFIIKLIFGEVAILLLGGNRISSKKIRNKGFEFKYPNIAIALKNL